MLIPIVISGTLFIIAAIFAIVKFNVKNSHLQNLRQNIVHLEDRKNNLEKELDASYHEKAKLQSRIEELLMLNGQKDSSIAVLQNKISNLENDHAQLKSEAIVGDATKKLTEQFEKIVENMAVLNNEIKASKDSVENVKAALLSPAGAGSLAEITLENILKSSGLKHEQDYIIQYAFSTNNSSNRLRPDAIVFLPGNNIMIIDSKASKYFTELSVSHTGESEEELNAKLKNTMRAHVKNLISKDYQDYLRDHLHGKEVNHISSIMFLPSESALDKLSSIDKEFLYKAWEKDIFPVGPSGLINILTYARFQISNYNQIENHKLILEETTKLLHSLSAVYEHTRKLGTSLYNTCNHFDRLAGSFNSNLLPKAKNLEKLGVHVQKTKSLPTHIERFTVISTNKNDVIDVEQADGGLLAAEESAE